MKLRFFYAVFLLTTVLTPTASSQEKPENKLYVTDAEHRQIRALAMRFVERLQQTHDVAPLIREFFIRDFASCLRTELEKHTNPKGKRLALPTNEILRGYIAEMNLHYVTTVGFTYDTGSGVEGNYDPFKSAFPPRIQKQIDALNLGWC